MCCSVVSALVCRTQLLEIKKRVEEDKKCKQRDLELKEQSLEQFALQGMKCTDENSGRAKRVTTACSIMMCT